MREKVLGHNVLINTNSNYSYVLEDSFIADCDGVKVKVPQPARYVTHKIHVYLKNYKYRIRDIATAYYCLTKQAIQDHVSEYAPNIIDAEPVKEIIQQLPGFIQNKDGLAVQDIQKTFAQIAYYEEVEDILDVLNWILASLNRKPR